MHLKLKSQESTVKPESAKVRPKLLHSSVDSNLICVKVKRREEKVWKERSMILESFLNGWRRRADQVTLPALSDPLSTLSQLYRPLIAFTTTMKEGERTRGVPLSLRRRRPDGEGRAAQKKFLRRGFRRFHNEARTVTMGRAGGNAGNQSEVWLRRD